MRKIILYGCNCLLLLNFVSCRSNEEEKTEGQKASIKEEQVSYMSDGIEMKSYIAYDENNKNKRPAVLVIPEWWGVNDYIRSRIKQLAELGYVAMAVDFYGNGKQADIRIARENWLLHFMQIRKWQKEDLMQLKQSLFLICR